MGYIATDLARVPTVGFKWYVFLLEDRWNDQLREELSRNFEALAIEAGPGALVVRGSEPQEFYDRVFQAYALDRKGLDYDRFPFPCLLITDIPPTEFHEDMKKIESVKMILIPLRENYVHPGSITAVLREVSASLRNEDSIDSLETLDPSKIEHHWGWITRYFDLKPNFFGFGIDLDQVIDDLFVDRAKGDR